MTLLSPHLLFHLYPPQHHPCFGKSSRPPTPTGTEGVTMKRSTWFAIAAAWCLIFGTATVAIAKHQAHMAQH
jgi:hypothetical protein